MVIDKYVDYILYTGNNLNLISVSRLTLVKGQSEQCISWYDIIITQYIDKASVIYFWY